MIAPLSFYVREPSLAFPDVSWHRQALFAHSGNLRGRTSKVEQLNLQRSCGLHEAAAQPDSAKRSEASRSYGFVRLPQPLSTIIRELPESGSWMHELETDSPPGTVFSLYAHDAAFPLCLCFIVYKKNCLPGLHRRGQRDQSAVNVHCQGARNFDEGAIVTGGPSVDEHRHSQLQPRAPTLYQPLPHRHTYTCGTAKSCGQSWLGINLLRGMLGRTDKQVNERG